jgi:hypothetical protein
VWDRLEGTGEQRTPTGEESLADLGAKPAGIVVRLLSGLFRAVRFSLVPEFKCTSPAHFSSRCFFIEKFRALGEDFTHAGRCSSHDSHAAETAALHGRFFKRAGILLH